MHDRVSSHRADVPRRALIDGLWVRFQSRNPNITSVRWPPRMKHRYRTKADALAAKEAWEEKGRIVWPEDFKLGKTTAGLSSGQKSMTEIRTAEITDRAGPFEQPGLLFGPQA